MTDVKHLNGLKVGDKVCLKRTLNFRRKLIHLTIGQVEKVTATQITAFGDRWSKKTAMRISDSGCFGECISVWSEALQNEADKGKKEIEAERICRAVASYLEKLKDEDAVPVAALLPGELIKGAFAK